MGTTEQFYDANTEYEWKHLERHRIEYGLTMCALQEHLPEAPARVVDIGGGVGRYAIELARRGYEVTLVDLSSKALAFAQDKARESGVRLAAYVHADAKDLATVPSTSFDAAILMGPLYHLLEHQQRPKAVHEAWRALRPGGTIFAAFVGRYSILQYAAARSPDFIVRRVKETKCILQNGVFQQVEPDGTFDNAWFAHPSDIAPLMAGGGFLQVDFLHCEPLTCELETKINEAPPDLHREWIDLLYRLSRDSWIMGGGGHIL